MQYMRGAHAMHMQCTYNAHTIYVPAYAMQVLSVFTAHIMPAMLAYQVRRLNA